MTIPMRRAFSVLWLADPDCPAQQASRWEDPRTSVERRAKEKLANEKHATEGHAWRRGCLAIRSLELPLKEPPCSEPPQARSANLQALAQAPLLTGNGWTDSWPGSSESPPPAQAESLDSASPAEG